MDAPKIKADIFIQGHQGIGDNLYQRPHIAELSKHYNVYLETPWPQLYWDLPIKFIKPETLLRAQKNNIKNWLSWSDIPRPIFKKKLQYTLQDFKAGRSITQAFEKIIPGDYSVKLKPKLEWIEESYNFVPKWDEFILVKPCTERKEWLNKSRNCNNSYIQDIVDYLKCYTTIGIANLKHGEEWLVAPELTGLTRQYYYGECSIEILIALTYRSILNVGPVGFNLPLGLALDVPTFILFGGSVKPECLIGKPTKNIAYAAPTNFCHCLSKTHDCNKKIDKLMPKFLEFWHGPTT